MSRQEAVRSLFHGLANKLNNVTTKAGSIPLMIGDYRSMSKEMLVEELSKILNELQTMERSAVEAGAICLKLKAEIQSALKDAETKT